MGPRRRGILLVSLYVGGCVGHETWRDWTSGQTELTEVVRLEKEAVAAHQDVFRLIDQGRDAEAADVFERRCRPPLVKAIRTLESAIAIGVRRRRVDLDTFLAYLKARDDPCRLAVVALRSGDVEHDAEAAAAAWEEVERLMERLQSSPPRVAE